MAGDKKNLHEPDLRLRALDLDALDDDLDLTLDGKKGSAVRQFSTAFKDGFLEQNKARVLLRRFLKGALPEGYSRVFSGAEQAFDASKRIASDVKRQSAPDIDALVSHAESNLPRVQGRVNERTYGKIKDRLEKLKSTQGGSIASHATSDQGDIQYALDELTERQNELEALKIDSDMVRDDRDNTQRALRDRVEDRRFDILTNHMGRISAGVERQVSYQDRITYQYQRRSLELQYRSFFALRDMRKYAEVSQKLHERAFTALVNNTGLPDHLKARKSERVRFGASSAITNAVGMQVTQGIGGYLSTYGSTIADNITRQIGGLLSGANTAAAGASAAGNLGGSMGGAGLLGNLIGDQVGSFLGNTVLGRLARSAQPKMDQLGDQYTGGMQHRASYFLNNMPSIIQDYNQDLNRSTGMSGILQSILRKVAPSYMLDDEIENGSYQTIDRQAGFNQLTQRSIVEVIPGYLSKILQETRMIRTGSDDVEREVYDVTKGTFSGYKDAQANLKKRVINEGQRKAIDLSLTEAVDSYDPEQYLSSDARETLRERLLNDAMRNRRFDAASYSTGTNYSENASDEVRDELQRFFKSQFDFDDDGKLVGNAENRRRQNDFSDAFLRVRESVPDPRAEIRRLMESGSQELLRGLGLVTNQFGQDRIDYDSIIDQYKTEGKETPQAGKTGTAPRTSTGPNIDPDAPGFADQFADGLKSVRNYVTGRAGALRIPQLTDELIGKMLTLNNATLAELVRWNPTLLDRLKAVDPDIGVRIKRDLKRLEGKSTRLTRDTIHALIDLARGDQGDSYTDESGTERPVPSRSPSDDIVDTLSGTRSSDPTRGGVDPITAEAQARAGQDPATRMYGFTALHRRTQTQPDVVSGVSQNVVDSSTRNHLSNIESQMGQLVAGSQDQWTDQRTFYSEILRRLDSGINVAGITSTGSVDAGNADSGDDDGRSNLKWWQQGILSTANLTKDTVGSLWNIQKKALGAAGGLGGKALGIAGDIGSKGLDVLSLGRTAKDVYVQGGDEPVMLGRDISDGRYVDSDSGDVIKTIDDIKGPVWDTKLERIALSQEDIQQGIYIRKSGGFYRKAIKGVWNFYGQLGSGSIATMSYLLPKATSFARDVIMPMGDAYLPGEEDPVILARLLKKGHYTDGQGRPYYSYSDIDDDVFAPGPQLIISADDIGKLRRRDGGRLESLGTKLGGMAKKSLKMAGSLVRRQVQHTKNLMRGVGRAGRRLFGRMTPEDLEEMGVRPPGGEGGSVYGEKSVSLLSAIYRLLDHRLAKADRFRDGSWQEEFAEREEDAEARAERKAERESRRKGVTGDMHRELQRMGAMYKNQQSRLDEIIENTEDGSGGGDIDIDLGGDRRRRGRFGRMASRAWQGAKRLGGRAGALALTAGGTLGTAAMATGSAVGSAAMWAGRGALGLAATLGAPVTLAVAAAAGVAVGGWMLWKNRDAADGVFAELRLTQYGFPAGWFTRQPKRIRALEEYLSSAVNASAQDATLDMSRVDPKEVLDILGTDTDDENALLSMGTWFAERFKPIFLSYHKALAMHAPEVNLSDMDDKLEAGRAQLVLADVQFGYGADSPYNVMASPFDPEEPIDVSMDDIRERVKDVREEHPADESRTQRRADRMGGAAIGSVAAIKASAQQATKLGVDAERRHQRTQTTLGHTVSRSFDPMKQTAVVAGALTIQRVEVPEFRQNLNGMLTSLQAIRLRAYGLVDITRSEAISMLRLEDQMRSYVEHDKAGVEFSGSNEAIFAQVAAQFGLDDSEGSSDMGRFVAWFTTRFLPTYLAYLNGILMVDPNASMTDVELKLNKGQKADIAKAVVAAKYHSVSVWDSPHVIYPTEGLSDARAMAELDLIALTEDAKDETLPTPSGSNDANAISNGKINENAKERVLRGRGSRKRSENNTSKSTGSSDGYTINKPYSNQGGTAYGQGGAGGVVGALGSSGKFITKGNGGAWEDIPLPKSNRSYEGAMPTLLAVERLTGVSASLLATFASIESNFDYQVKAKTSSATGWFQFINSTWDWMMDRFATKYQIPVVGKSTSEVRAMRKDPRINALMGAEFLKDNAKVLKSKLGREPSDTDLYLAHFLGAGTAAKFLAEDTNANAARLYPKQASANKSIFYTNGRARTIGEVYKLMDGKVAGHRKGEYVSATVQAPDEILNPGIGDADAMDDTTTKTKTGSVNTQVSQTVNAYNQTQGGYSAPLTTGAPSATTPRPTAPTATETETLGSPVASSDPVIAQQQAKRENARRADRVQQEKAAQTQSQTNEMGRIMQDQLAVQMEMRDYLKRMASNMGYGKGDQSSETTGVAKPEATATNTARRDPGIDRRKPPVSMSRG